MNHRLKYIVILLHLDRDCHTISQFQAGQRCQNEMPTLEKPNVPQAEKLRLSFLCLRDYQVLAGSTHKECCSDGQLARRNI